MRTSGPLRLGVRLGRGVTAAGLVGDAAPGGESDTLPTASETECVGDLACLRSNSMGDASLSCVGRTCDSDCGTVCSSAFCRVCSGCLSGFLIRVSLVGRRSVTGALISGFVGPCGGGAGGVIICVTPFFTFFDFRSSSCCSCSSTIISRIFCRMSSGLSSGQSSSADIDPVSSLFLNSSGFWKNFST
jgi:hypothetical protein